MVGIDAQTVDTRPNFNSTADNFDYTSAEKVEKIIEIPTETAESIRLFLDKKSSKKIHGARKIIKLMSLGYDCSSFYVNAVKSCFESDYELSYLLDIFIGVYSEKKSSMAEMSIQNYQNKAKNSIDSWQCALGLKAYTNLNVNFHFDEIFNIANNLVFSTHVGVIKSLSLGMLKIYSKDPTLKPRCLEIVSKIFERTNENADLLSAPLYSFSMMADSNDLHLLHKHFYPVLNALSSIEYIYVPSILNMLSVYCRTFFTKPDYDFPVNTYHASFSQLKPKIDHLDLFALLKSVTLLLKFYHLPVIMAAVKFIINCGPPCLFRICIKPVMRLFLSFTEFLRQIYIMLINLDEERIVIMAPHILEIVYIQKYTLTQNIHLLDKFLIEENKDDIMIFLQDNLHEARTKTDIQAIIDLIVKIVFKFEANDQYFESIFFLLESKDQYITEAILNNLMKLLSLENSEFSEKLIGKLIAMISQWTLKSESIKANLLNIFTYNIDRISSQYLFRILQCVSINFKLEYNEIKSLMINFAVALFEKFTNNNHEDANNVGQILQYFLKICISDKQLTPIKIKAKIIDEFLKDLNSFFRNYNETFYKPTPTRQTSEENLKIHNDPIFICGNTDFFDLNDPFKIPKWSDEPIAAPERLQDVNHRNDDLKNNQANVPIINPEIKSSDPKANMSYIHSTPPKPNAIDMFNEFSSMSDDECDVQKEKGLPTSQLIRENDTLDKHETNKIALFDNDFSSN